LTIEDPNTIDSELIDALSPKPPVPAPLRRPKWEKRLSKLFAISALDARGTSLLLPVEIGTTDTSELHSVKALLDSGATGSFIDRDFVCSKGMNTWTLSRNIPVFTVDGSPNEAGQISEVVDVVLRYKTHSERMLLAVSGLGKQSLILGYDWLKDHKTSQHLAEGARRSKETQAATALLPAYIAEFQSVFAKEDFDILPEHHKWDHAIELIPRAEPKSSKVYPLSPLEQTELDAFLEENLRTGRIRPSKSPIAAPVFFIKKKDGSLWLVQDYCALNAVTVKNRYPLPLISELVSQLCRAKYFTKLDV